MSARGLARMYASLISDVDGVRLFRPDRLKTATAVQVDQLDHTIGAPMKRALGYGVGGPLDHKRAYDLLVQAEGGSCSITGLPGQPAKSGIPVADIATALYAHSAVLAALLDRTRTGRGAVIPIAMIDVVAEAMGWAINQVVHAGTELEPVGMGSPMVAPYGAYVTSDGQTVVLGTTSDREWQRLATALLGRPDLAADPSLARNSDRVARRADLDRVLAQWCAQRPLAEIQRRADDAGIGNARLNSVRDLAEHPQLAQRGRWREVATPAGPVPALLPPALARGWPVRSGSVPALGADTEAIRAEFGGGAVSNPARAVRRPGDTATRGEVRECDS